MHHSVNCSTVLPAMARAYLSVHRRIAASWCCVLERVATLNWIRTASTERFGDWRCLRDSSRQPPPAWPRHAPWPPGTEAQKESRSDFQRALLLQLGTRARVPSHRQNERLNLAAF